MAPKWTVTQISRELPCTWLLRTITWSLFKLYWSTKQRWSGKMTWSAHLFIWLASAAVLKPLWCFCKTGQTFTRKITASGLLYTTQPTMGILKFATPCSSGRPTMMCSAKSDPLKTKSLSTYARVTLARKLLIISGVLASKEISTLSEFSSEKVKMSTSRRKH